MRPELYLSAATVALLLAASAASAETIGVPVEHQADVGADCYIVDDQTVAKTNGTNTRSVAGKIIAVDADGVWVKLGQ